MSHFINILKRRQKLISLKILLVRQRPSESQTELSGAKRQKMKEKKSQKDGYRMFFVEGDSPSI